MHQLQSESPKPHWWCQTPEQTQQTTPEQTTVQTITPIQEKKKIKKIKNTQTANISPEQILKDLSYQLEKFTNSSVSAN